MSRRPKSKLRPWAICPRDVYSAGFLGGFAKDDSFLNRSHLAPEYFTKDSLNGGFKQRFNTRHGPLYHFWPGIPDRFCPLPHMRDGEGYQLCPIGDIAAFPFREQSSNLAQRTGRPQASFLSSGVSGFSRRCTLSESLARYRTSATASMSGCVFRLRIRDTPGDPSQQLSEVLQELPIGLTFCFRSV
jgi:hypothetical protein